MNNNPLFSINNLFCQYKESVNPVLHIAELQIKRGDIVFFVGPSGVGKSTLLETLGLMNDTTSISEAGSISFFSNGREYDMKGLWKGNEKALSEFRKSFFSFIFQNTNLFTTLSAIDNVNIVQLLRGIVPIEADRKTRAMFKELELPDDMSKDYPVTSLSGGQRQRVAFARAIVSDFDVLFADEPTGNLDWFNADKVMNVVKTEIKSLDKSGKLRSAVIVSHDTELALKFADTIVFIEKNDASQMGHITNSSVYRKSQDHWKSDSAIYNREEMKMVMRNLCKKTKERQL
jgi:ABC-type lipoprotein export system ATPase subunit